MYPGMMHWWSTHRCDQEWRTHAGCGAGGWRAQGGHTGWTERHAAPGDCSELGAGAFGVRRPLRFLAYKLHLDERQVGELARILDALKTERAQAEVDGRRAMAGLADAVAGASFDPQVAGDAARSAYAAPSACVTR